MSLVGLEGKNWFLFSSICSLIVCLIFCMSIFLSLLLSSLSACLFPSHTLTNMPHIAHTHTHKNKCQSSSTSCCPQVMCAWYFVKMTAEESHHKLLLTAAASPTAHHSIHYAQSHCNFLYPVSLPSTPL